MYNADQDEEMYETNQILQVRTINPSKKVLTFGFDKVKADPSLLETIDNLDSMDTFDHKAESGSKSRSRKTISKIQKTLPPNTNLNNKRIFINDALDITQKELDSDKKDIIEHFIDLFNQVEEEPR